MAARKATTADTETRTLEVRTQHEGIFRIDIPAGWKITFSKVNPQSGGYESCALRVYEAEDRQRACFTNVVSFRDVSIPFTRRVKKTKESSRSERGHKKASTSHEVEHDYEWISDPEGETSPF